MEGKSPMRRTLAVVLAAALLLVVGAVAYASIPGPDGVIHGCYKTSNPAQGALIAIDSGASCPSGYTALNWNQTGPQGPAGSTGSQGPARPSGMSSAEWVIQTLSVGASAGFISKTVAAPAGKVILSGGFWARPNSQIGYTAGWEATVNGPSTDANGDATSWAVEGYSTRTAAWTLVVYALAIDDPTP